ncbi:Coq4 family protein [uncultured Chryseobacterium sp.]|uniref:Coq4 family protein n=1 Tax=uncultured Chryseobacterium sp. TaxID=259322 RepID=UPI0026225A3C|nr:Coq4 family protein [uncultured Chryseobacterium sp.]
MYEKSQHHYRKFFKRNKRKWHFTEEQLLLFQEDSLGRKLGEFYKKHGFRMIPQMENHDVYHLITGCSTKIEDEIAMQYLLFGNGKRSAYLLGVLFLGTMVFPEKLGIYLKAFRKGRKMSSFHNWDFESLLALNINTLLHIINPAKS